jgi:hypothetical protein
MDGKCWRALALAGLFALVVLCGARAGGDKVIDGGKADKFKGKKFNLKDKGKAKIALTFAADQTYSLTVKSAKETDINLFVYDADGKEVAKDDSPGPSCDITFTPTKAGKYILEIVNKGPGANTSTLKVARKKKKTKE